MCCSALVKGKEYNRITIYATISHVASPVYELHNFQLQKDRSPSEFCYEFENPDPKTYLSVMLDDDDGLDDFKRNTINTDAVLRS